jgi:hypothetical protein
MIAVGVTGQRHPHILLIVLDDAGYNDFDWMGTANNQFYTPFLRGMAERGVLLKHHYTYVLACVPSLDPLDRAQTPSLLSQSHFCGHIYEIICGCDAVHYRY